MFFLFINFLFRFKKCVFVLAMICGIGRNNSRADSQCLVQSRPRWCLNRRLKSICLIVLLATKDKTTYIFNITAGSVNVSNELHDLLLTLLDRLQINIHTTRVKGHRRYCIDNIIQIIGQLIYLKQKMNSLFVQVNQYNESNYSRGL